MAILVLIPAALRQYAGGSDAVRVEGTTVEEALASLVRTHATLKKHLMSDDGRLRSFVNVYLNDEDIRYRGGAGTALRDGDTISIIPSIAGGSGKPELTHEELLRYSRHLILPEVGVEGQMRLKA